MRESRDEPLTVRLFMHLVGFWPHASPLASFYTIPGPHFPLEPFSDAKKQPTSLVGGERLGGGCWQGMQVPGVLKYENECKKTLKTDYIPALCKFGVSIESRGSGERGRSRKQP